VVGCRVRGRGGRARGLLLTFRLPGLPRRGRHVRIGGAVVRVGDEVTRCAVTTRDPDTATRDLDTLRVLADYRGRRESDGMVLFGVYAYVEQPGRVRVGDPVELL